MLHRVELRDRWRTVPTRWWFLVSYRAAGLQVLQLLTCVLGDYDELDKDEGDILYYSGSDSNMNVDPVNPIMTHHTKALQKSRRDARPVRVLRTSAGKAAHCPSRGIRYDGLYRIVAEGIARNTRGGAYVRFKLERINDQANMDLSRPSQEEKAVFDRLKSSI